MTGLIDGSLSTLARIFAVAFATHQPHDAFLAGLAAAIGAGVSMAFSEGLSDTGDVTGRGSPYVRGGADAPRRSGMLAGWLLTGITLAVGAVYLTLSIWTGRCRGPRRMGFWRYGGGSSISRGFSSRRASSANATCTSCRASAAPKQ
jgi:hypothetical protein